MELVKCSSINSLTFATSGEGTTPPPAKIVSFVLNSSMILKNEAYSMIPLFELKVGIPFGMNSEFWLNPLSNFGALFSAITGGLIVTIILALIFEPLYEKIKDKKFFKSFISFFTSSAIKKTEEIESKSELSSKQRKQWIKILSVFLFVAIPIPGTGVYTGTVLAVFLGLKFWQTLLFVTLGNIVGAAVFVALAYWVAFRKAK